MRFNTPGRFNRSAFNTDRVFTFPALEVTVKNSPTYPPEWLYLKEITLNNTGAELTNYQLKFTVNRSAGVDSGYTVYVDTKCLENYNDIRFTTSDGVTLLDYWIESSDSNTATIWVEVETIAAAGDTTIYLYYGNTGAAAVSDGDATFPFFDDFSYGSTVDPSKWQILYSQSYSITGGILTVIGTSAVDTSIDSYGGAGFGYAMRSSSRWDTKYFGSYFGLYTVDYGNWDGAYWENADTRAALAYRDNTGTEYGDIVYGSTFHIYEIQRISASSLKFYRDGVLFLDVTDTNYISTETKPIRLSQWKASHSQAHDWILLRQIVATEPTVSAWGVEIELNLPGLVFSFDLTQSATVVNNDPDLEQEFSVTLSSTVENAPELTHAIQINLDGVWELGFTAGSSEFQVGETVTGDTSGATGTVIAVDVTSGSWAGSDAAGTILIEDVEGVFEDGEDLNGSVSGDDAAEADGSQERITPKVVSKAVWKGIDNVYWTAHVDLYGLYAYTANANYRELLVSMVDHLGASNEIFNGFVPLQGLVQNPGENITSLTAFSHSWYLANQYVPDEWRGTAIWNPPAGTLPGYISYYEPSVIVTALLGGALYNLVTGIRPTYINTVTDWGTSDRPERPFAWRPSASKWDAIQEICDYLGYAFDVIWNPTNRRQDGSFCDIADIDTYMGIPAAVTFAHDASPGYVLNVHKEKRGTEQINRVRVQGRRNKRILHFVNGVTAFTPADIVVDGGTGAEATIISCTLTAGAWDGTAVGYLIISYDRTGDFLDGNSIVSTLGAGWGQATMQGNSVPYELYDEYPYYIESAEVSNIDGDRPRERFFELEDEWDSTPLIQVKCQEYYDLFSLDASNYTVTFRDRCDLRLWQNVKLTGFSDIPEDWMRIVHIRYEERDAGNVIVSAVLNNADYVMSQRKMRRSLKPDDVSAIEAMIQAILDKNLKVDDAEVLKVDGEYYSVELVDGQITFVAKGTE